MATQDLTDWVKAQVEFYEAQGGAGALVAAKLDELFRELVALGRPSTVASYHDRADALNGEGR